MLILSRKLGEAVRIGDAVSVRPVEYRNGTVRLAFEAPESVRICREELPEDSASSFRCPRGLWPSLLFMLGWLMARTRRELAYWPAVIDYAEDYHGQLRTLKSRPFRRFVCRFCFGVQAALFLLRHLGVWLQDEVRWHKWLIGAISGLGWLLHLVF